MFPAKGERALLRTIPSPVHATLQVLMCSDQAAYNMNMKEAEYTFVLH